MPRIEGQPVLWGKFQASWILKEKVCLYSLPLISCTPFSGVCVWGLSTYAPFQPCLEACSLGVIGEDLGRQPRSLLVVQIPFVPGSAGSLREGPWWGGVSLAHQRPREEGSVFSSAEPPATSRTLGLACTDSSQRLLPL